MSLLIAVTEWSHRRYWSIKVWYQNRLNYGVEMEGDPHVPLKGLWTGWRRKWSWAVVRVSLDDQGQTCYWPGYSLDGGQSFRHVIRPVMTRCFAFQIGPDPVMFSVFGKNTEKIPAHCDLEGIGFTWSAAVKYAGGHQNITFV